MSIFSRLRGSRSARGTPPMRRALRGHPFLLPILTVVLLSQTGCQSGMFGPCSSSCGTSPCSDGPIRTWFRQRGWSMNRATPIYGGAVTSGVPVMEGAPAMVAPAPIGTPAGSALPSPTEVSPSLEPIPSATPGPTPSSGSTPTGSGGSNGSTGARAPTGATGKLNYEATRPRFWFGRGSGGVSPQRNYVQRTPSPTYRSAQGVAVASGTTELGAKSADLRPTELSMLDNLPPLDLPRSQNRSDIKTAAASPADREPAPSALPGPVEATENAPAEVATPPPSTEVSVAPGLKRFAVVEPKLAGGSLPSADGLDWLSEKGYKTLLDLREPGDVQSTFLAEVSRRGLRYISLPVSLATVDHDHVARFGFEISLADARPIYFFDADGKRAGMLWYIRRMTEKNESYDPDDAARQAEEIGLEEGPFKKAAKTYLDGLKKAASRTQTAAPAPAPALAKAPRQEAPAAATTLPAPAPATDSASGPDQDAQPLLPERSEIPEKPEALVLPLPDAAKLNLARATGALNPAAPAGRDGTSAGDPEAWRPYLALLLAALGVPVAYCGRSLIQFRGLVRASLPGPRRPLRSLPAASGE